MLCFKASFYLYISHSTKTRDRHPGLLQSLFPAFSLVCFSSCRDQIPCCLNCASGIPLVTKCKSLPCVILILDHVIISHVLLSAAPSRPKSGKRVQCTLQC